MTYPPQGPPGWPPPQGYPPHQGYPSPNGPPQWPLAGPPPKRTKMSGLVKTLITVSVIVVIAFVGLIGFAFFKVAREGEATTAQSVSDFSAVCKNDWVSNAAEYGTPYHVAAFYQGLGIMGPTWLSADTDKGAASGKLSDINVVACLERKKGSEVKSTSCEYTDGGDRVTVDHYSVQYTIEFREAKTGKVVGSSGTVSGTADHCPFLASYERNSRKMYAAPDADAVAAEIAGFTG